MPGNAKALPQATSDQPDVPSGGQQVFVDDLGSFAAVPDKDEALARDRENPRLVIDIRDKELLDPFLLVELNPPTLGNLNTRHRLLSRGDQPGEQRRD